MSPCRHVVMSTCRRHVGMFIWARIVLSLPKRAHVDWNWLISRDKDLNKDWSVKMPLHWRIRELKKTTTATTTPLNKRSNEQNNSCARALQFMIHFFYEAVLVSKLRYAFDKLMEEYHRVPSSQVKACDLHGFVQCFFSETLHNNIPVARAKQLSRSMKKTTSCKKAADYPTRPHRWLGRKISNQRWGLAG